ARAVGGEHVDHHVAVEMLRDAIGGTAVEELANVLTAADDDVRFDGARVRGVVRENLIQQRPVPRVDRLGEVQHEPHARALDREYLQLGKTAHLPSQTEAGTNTCPSKRARAVRRMPDRVT